MLLSKAPYNKYICQKKRNNVYPSVHYGCSSNQVPSTNNCWVSLMFRVRIDFFIFPSNVRAANALAYVQTSCFLSEVNLLLRKWWTDRKSSAGNAHQHLHHEDFYRV